MDKEYNKLRDELIEMLTDMIQDKNKLLVILMRMLSEQTELNNLRSALELAEHKARFYRIEIQVV